MRPKFYRVRLPGGDGLTGGGGTWWVGVGLVSDLDVLRPVLEPDALCLDTPREAAEAGLRYGAIPFTVEVAS
jgi:hypothetical protein